MTAMPPSKKRTSRKMRCFTCDETTMLKLDATKYAQYDAWAAKHDHDPEWKRWIHNRNTFPSYPDREIR